MIDIKLVYNTTISWFDWGGKFQKSRKFEKIIINNDTDIIRSDKWGGNINYYA